MSILRSSGIGFPKQLLHKTKPIAIGLHAYTSPYKLQPSSASPHCRLQHSSRLSSIIAHAMPANRAAWITEAKANPFVVKEAPYTDPGATEVLVKNAVVAMTPISHKVQDFDLMKMPYPSILGNEVAGEIVAVGDQVTGLKVGQRVTG